MQNGSYGQKEKTEKVKPKIRWWKRKEISRQEAFRQEVTRILGDKDGLSDEWDKTAEMLRKTAETVLNFCTQLLFQYKCLVKLAHYCTCFSNTCIQFVALLPSLKNVTLRYLLSIYTPIYSKSLQKQSFLFSDQFFSYPHLWS